MTHQRHCGNCENFRANPKNLEVGDCCAELPKVLMAALNNRGEPIQLAGWPSIRRTDWCRHHELKREDEVGRPVPIVTSFPR